MFLSADGATLLASLELAAASTALAVLLAFPVGIHAGKSRRKLFFAAALLPLLIPPQVAAYVWRFLMQDQKVPRGYETYVRDYFHGMKSDNDGK